MGSLSDLFDAYYSIISDVNRLAGERHEQNAMELITLRRQLAEVAADMQRATDGVRSRPNVTPAARKLIDEHRLMFAAERAAVANSQAKWAAPEMKRNRADYESDVRAVHAMHQKNHQWRKTVLLPAIDHGFP